MSATGQKRFSRRPETSGLPTGNRTFVERVGTVVLCHEQRYFYYLAIRQANSTTVAPSAAAITDVTIPPPSARSTAM
jgi:hypothetical protein